MHAVLLGRASPVATSVAFMSLIPAVLLMILKPLPRYYRSVLLICPHPRGYYRDITVVALTVSCSRTYYLYECEILLM